MRKPTLSDAARTFSLSSGLQKSQGDVFRGLQKPLGDASYAKWAERPELPGGSTLSLCKESLPTDIFNITSAELAWAPIHIDDMVRFNIYGEFQSSFDVNSTLSFTVDCGSHCEEYQTDPEDLPWYAGSAPFCEIAELMQPTGGKKKPDCPPEKGWALLSALAWVPYPFFQVPMWYNFTFDAKTSDGERIFCVTTEVCLKYADEQKNIDWSEFPAKHCTWPR